MEMNKYGRIRQVDGYKGKIEYYRHKVLEAIDSSNPKSVEFYTQKLVYFMNRQIQTQ
jgi:hypothetical protein